MMSRNFANNFGDSSTMGFLGRREFLNNPPPSSGPSSFGNTAGVIVATNDHNKEVVVRSFRRVAAILGISVAAVGVWYGASYLYYNHYVPYRQRQEALEFQAAAAAVVESPLVRTPSGAFNIENVLGDAGSASGSTIHVVLHQCPRGYYSPCISPFPFKLETFLRVARIPYEVTFAAQQGEHPSKNTPWLTINGRDVLEAQQCIPELCGTFGIDLERGSTRTRQTACRLIASLLDYKIYWGVAVWRWVFDEGKSIKSIQPLSRAALETIPEVTESIRRASLYQGLGRLGPKKVVEVIMKDLADLSAALGKHPYFLGTSPGEVDCAAFSLLAQMVFNMPGSPFETGINKFENLMDFVLRIKDNYWPDWNSMLQIRSETKLTEPLILSTTHERGTTDGPLTSNDVPSEDSSTEDAHDVNESQQLEPAVALQESLKENAPVNNNMEARNVLNLVVNQDEQLQKRVNFVNQDEQLLQQKREAATLLQYELDAAKLIEIERRDQKELLEIAKKIKAGGILSEYEEFKWDIHKVNTPLSQHLIQAQQQQLSYPYTGRPYNHADYNQHLPPTTEFPSSYQPYQQQQQGTFPNYYGPAK